MRVVSRGDAQSFYFLNIFTSRNSNKIKFFKYEQTVRKLNPNQTLIGSDKNL